MEGPKAASAASGGRAGSALSNSEAVATGFGAEPRNSFGNETRLGESVLEETAGAPKNRPPKISILKIGLG